MEGLGGTPAIPHDLQKAKFVVPEDLFLLLQSLILRDAGSAARSAETIQRAISNRITMTEHVTATLCGFNEARVR
jgi:hypothetical protein